MSFMKNCRVFGKWALAALLLSTFWLAGCGTTEPKGQFSPLTEEQQAAVAVTPEPVVDLISKGEAITITLTDIPNIVPPIEERVKEDGTVTLIQNQTFVAAGKTRRQLETEIRERYVPKYYVNMSVSVKQQENTRFYFVGGEVRVPGRQVYIGSMTVLKAIQSCGDFTDFANRRKVRLTRANGKIEIIDAKKALKNPSLDLAVFPGDSINVPRTIW